MANGILRFDMKQLVDLNEDLRQSPKSLPIVVQRVLSLTLRQLAVSMRSLVPRGATGALRRSLSASVKRQQGAVVGVFGLLSSRRSGRTVVAGNVLQKGGAVASKRQYIWIPLPGNKNVTPQDFFNAGNTFIRTSKAGNRIAFIRTGEGTALPMFVLKKTVRFHQPPIPIQERVEAELPTITGDIQEGIAAVIIARQKALEI